MSSASEQETPQWMTPILAAVQVAVLGEMVYTVRRALVRMARTCSVAYICAKAYLRSMWHTSRRRWTVVAAYAIRGPLKSSDSQSISESDSQSDTQSISESSASKTQDFVVLDHMYMRPGDDPDWTSHIFAQVPVWWGHQGWRVELRVQRGCQKRRVCLPATTLPRIHEVLQWPRDIHCRFKTAIVASACLIPAPGQQEVEGSNPERNALDITSRVQKYVMLRDVPMHPAWLFPMDDMDSMMGRWLGVSVRTLDLWGHSKTYDFEWHDDMRIMFYNTDL